MPSLQEKESSVKNLPFNETPSFQALQHLAQNPFDLTKPGGLTPERISTFVAQACGFKLLYATERVTKDVMEALYSLAAERDVLQKMKQMQAGAVTNFIQGFESENRAVLHTALRDQFDNPREETVAKEAAKKAKNQLEALRKFADEIHKDKAIQNLIVIAIGGSELGPKACLEALQYLKTPDRNVFYISNVDPDATAAILKKVHLKNTIVAVVSKSGTTLETNTNEQLLRNAFKKEGINEQQHFIAVTSEGSPMDNLKNYRYVFHMWDWVGGRFSSTSSVGGVPIVFAYGYDIFVEFLRGAHAMDVAALSSDHHTNLPLLGALLGIWNRNFLNHPTLAIIPYSFALRSFTAHLQQVDMESNGKRVDKQGRPVDFETGPIIWGRTGTDAQHSFFQLIHQGTTKIPIEFIGFAESQNNFDLQLNGTTSQQKLNANLFAQAISLATGQNSENPNKVFPGNTPSHILLARRLTPFQLGALLSYRENVIAFQGFIWNINSFDQEGVQLGKKLAEKLIERQKNQNQKELAYPIGDAYLMHIEKI